MTDCTCTYEPRTKELLYGLGSVARVVPVDTVRVPDPSCPVHNQANPKEKTS